MSAVNVRALVPSAETNDGIGTINHFAHQWRPLSGSDSSSTSTAVPTPTSSPRQSGSRASSIANAQPRSPQLAADFSRVRLSSDFNSTPGLRTPATPQRNVRRSPRVSVTRHDVRTEERPNNVFHSVDFQNAFLGAKHLVGRVAYVLASSNLHQDAQSTMHKLHSEAVELANFRCPTTRTIAFVGDSGVGKIAILVKIADDYL